jgi:KDO2-lipid IV(A) lauroyltransferase
VRPRAAPEGAPPPAAERKPTAPDAPSAAAPPHHRRALFLPHWARAGLRHLPAAGRRLGNLAEAALLRLAMAVFAWLPVDIASACGGRLARAIGPHLRVSRRALANLERVMPENDAAANRRILHGMWDNLGRAVAEHPHLRHICDADSGRVEIVNGSAIDDLMAGSRPAILFGGHVANWEVGPSTIHRLMGGALLSVYRAANNPWVDRMQRQTLGSRQAVAKGAQGGRALISHLRRGGHVAMLVDQKQNDGVAVPFFGVDAMTAPALARLALRFGCPILPVRVERLDGARFRFTVQPALEALDTGNTAADVLATMTRVNAVVEGWVRAQPEQWLWLHRRWPG